MSTDVTWQISSTSSDATEQLGMRLGKVLKGNEAIELTSDLGGGKTTFVRGLARGAGSKDKVASPSFTISKVYGCDTFAIHHFDFYRLAEPGIIAAELAEVVDDPRVVTVVEWGEVVQHVLPKARLTVTITQTPEGNRELTFTAPPKLSYLIEALQ